MEQALRETASPVCTSVCTSKAEVDKAGAAETDPLAKLAADLQSLSPADRQRLAAMLAGQQKQGEGKAQGETQQGKEG